VKIKTEKRSYAEVAALPPAPHGKPKRPSRLLHALIRLLSVQELRDTQFTYAETGMEKLGRREPCLILMNHSCFLDLKMAHAMLRRPFNIVCTSDGFVGKAGLMAHLGCIPTAKFVTDPQLVRDMVYALKTLKTSVLMYPEASYSFDGTATPLPESLGKCLKLLGVPVVMIRTYGAFTHDPLYNGLRQRRVPMRAEMELLFTAEDVKRLPAADLQRTLEERFTFDSFRWQQENRVRVTEDFRADGLNRVLYRCPRCQTEGKMEGKGTQLSCRSCKKVWSLTPEGFLEAENGETEYSQVADWYAWQRRCVREALEDGTYRLEVPVTVRMLVDTKAIYEVGEGVLRHDAGGFRLTGCDGQLDVTVPPRNSYSLYADYFWYEIGDMICIGDRKTLYYCFPHGKEDVVAKTRLATEELYKLLRGEKRSERSDKIAAGTEL